MKNVLKHFGKRVRDLRKTKCLSQEDLAEKADLHYTYIGGIERGERNLSLKNIEKIACALEVEIKDLFGIAFDRGDHAKTNDLINEINVHLVGKDVETLQLIKLLVEDVSAWRQKKRERRKD